LIATVSSLTGGRTYIGGALLGRTLMIRYALLLCAGLLAAACFACVQQQQAVVPPPSVPVRTVDCSSPGNFAASVQSLSAAFQPNPPNGSAPTSGGAINNPNIINDLSNAFSLAPQRLRDQLCGVYGPAVRLFVQDCPGGGAACSVGSWGYRQRNNDVPFIALSAGLWPGGGHAIAYPEFERTVINNLVGDLGQTFTASNSTPEMTVLAVLAHEMGHILAYRKQVLNQRCGNVSPPVQQIFWRNAWSSAANPDYFHRFGDQFPGDHRLRGLSKNQAIGNPVVLGRIYGMPRDQQFADWASLLANVAPDEDLIETYKFMILNTDNRLTSLIITIPNVGNVDIIQQLFPDPNGFLIKKATWVRNCFI
jgi:hypothetical protein